MQVRPPTQQDLQSRRERLAKTRSATILSERALAVQVKHKLRMSDNMSDIDIDFFESEREASVEPVALNIPPLPVEVLALICREVRLLQEDEYTWENNNREDLLHIALASRALCMSSSTRNACVLLMGERCQCLLFYLSCTTRYPSPTSDKSCFAG